MAVGRIAVGLTPILRAFSQLLWADQALCSTEAFQGHEPVLIAGISEVRVALGLRRVNLLAKHLDPFPPGKAASCGQMHGQSKHLGFPRRAEHWPAVVTGQCRESVDEWSGVGHHI